LGKEQSFGRLGLRTFAFYIGTTLLAVLVGVLVVNLIQPGLSYQIPPAEAAASANATQPLVSSLPTSHMDAIGKVLLRLIPHNIIAAAAEMNMLAVIFFSLLFGFALAKLGHEVGQPMVNFWRAAFSTLMKMTHFIMRAMPLGVFCLVAKVIAEHGFASIKGLAFFFITVVVGLLFYCLVALPLFLKARGISPILYIRSVGPALITAFSTSSSAATLPITMECVEKRAGVSNRICSFVVPLGTSMNMSGSALYECVAALFIAQVYGIELTIGHQIMIVILSLITSMGVAAIPSASLVAIIIILNAMGLPAEGLALIIPADRILDMCRTTVNVFSDAACAVLVAKSEGEPIRVASHKKVQG
jgi:Na+/H+-dicarboxylate symporter